MEAKKRLALVLVIILSGVLLVPFVALPKESFRWQLFAAAYGTGPVLDTDFGTGERGSFFLVAGFGYPANTTLTLLANGVEIGTVETDANGYFQVSLSTAVSGYGRYVITAVETSDSGNVASLAATEPATSFSLIAGAPLRPARAGVAQLAVPDVPAAITPGGAHLPLVTK